MPVLDVTIPVYNEEQDLEQSLRRLHAYLHGTFPHTFRITVADNASTDGTLRVAERVARELREVTVVRLPDKGRGNALRTVWLASPSPVLAYMDVNLSTDLAALAPLIAPLISGHSDLAIGTRLSRSSRVVRGHRRAFIPRGYNLLLHTLLGAHFSDAQCGFKAIRADIARQLLPHTADNAWFFDTELLVLAEKCGLRVHEVPVDWVNDADAGVDLLRTALADLRGMGRLSRDLATGRIPVPELRSALDSGSAPVTLRLNGGGMPRLPVPKPRHGFVQAGEIPRRSSRRVDAEKEIGHGPVHRGRSEERHPRHCAGTGEDAPCTAAHGRRGRHVHQHRIGAPAAQLLDGRHDGRRGILGYGQAWNPVHMKNTVAQHNGASGAVNRNLGHPIPPDSVSRLH